MTATTDLAGKGLKMRPHFPSAEPRTASETGRWFFCCACSSLHYYYYYSNQIKSIRLSRV